MAINKNPSITSGLLILSLLAQGSACLEATQIEAAQSPTINVQASTDSDELEIPKISESSVDELKSFVFGATLSSSQAVSKIFSAFSEHPELKALGKKLSKSLKGIFGLGAQLSPFDTENKEKLKHPELWMSMEELYTQLGAEAKLKVEQCNQKAMKMVEMIIVDSESFSEMFDRFSQYYASLRGSLEKLHKNSNYAKYSLAMTTQGDSVEVINMGIKARMASDEEFRDKVTKIFDRSLQVRKDVFAWLKVFQEGFYKNVHLPVHEPKVALERLNDLYTVTVEGASEVFDSMTEKWSKIK